MLRGIFTNIHKPEANNCFSIITQVIIEIPTHIDCWQSVFLSIFSLKENGTKHGRDTHKKKNRLQPLLMFLRTFTLVKII